MPDFPSVLAAIPSRGGRIDRRLAAFLTALSRTLPSGRFEVLIHPFCLPIAFARNRLVGYFLERTKAEVLWFLDDDAAPPLNGAGLLLTPGTLVSGSMLCMFRDPETKVLKVGLNGFVADSDGFLHNLVPDRGEAVYDIDACGTACLIVRRHVLEDARMLAPFTEQEAPPFAQRQVEDSWPVRPVFRHTYDRLGRWVVGEDLDFTARAVRLGYGLKYDLRHKFRHRKEMDLDDVLSLAVSYGTDLARAELAEAAAEASKPRLVEAS